MEVMLMSSRTRNLAQSLISLSFNLIALLAGICLVLYLDILSETSWALLLYPGILSVRGAVGGLFSGRLSTALHIGTIRTSYTKNTKNFYLLLSAIITLTFGSSIVMGLVASLFATLLLGITIMDSLTMLTVIISTMGISLLFISPITLGVSILSFKKGFDPDVIVYPIISTVADVLVTICYIFVQDSFFSSQLGQNLIILAMFFFMLVVGYLIAKNSNETYFVKTAKEFFLTLVLVAFMVNVTGTILHRISVVISGLPKIYLIYPALIDTIGSVGSIIGSTATTKLAIGVIKPSIFSLKHHLTEISSAWISSLIMFILYGVLASSVYNTWLLTEFFRFILQLLITNFLAVSLIVLVSFGVATSAKKRGLDPDNFVIPIESSLADSITTTALLITFVVI